MHLTGWVAFFVQNRGFHGHDLAIETTLFPSSNGFFLAGETEGIGILASDLIFLRNHGCTLKLTGRLIVLHVALAHGHTAGHIRSQRNHRHHFHTTGHHNIFHARANHGRCERRRLLAGSALRINRRRSHFLRKTLRKPGDPGDIERLLIDLGHTPANDLTDVCGIHPSTL